MASKQSIKGSNFERELAAYLNEHVYGREQCCRAPLSGGGMVGMVGGSDLIGTTGLFVEAKRVEKLNFLEALKQAENNIQKTGSPEAAIVINRRNRQATGESFIFMRLDPFLKFYMAWLHMNGYDSLLKSESTDDYAQPSGGFVVKKT